MSRSLDNWSCWKITKYEMYVLFLIYSAMLTLTIECQTCINSLEVEVITDRDTGLTIHHSSLLSIYLCILDSISMNLCLTIKSFIVKGNLKKKIFLCRRSQMLLTETHDFCGIKNKLNFQWEHMRCWSNYTIIRWYSDV